MLLREVFALALVLALALLASRIGRWLRCEKAATDSPSPTTPTPTLTPKSSEVLAGASESGLHLVGNEQPAGITNNLC